MSVAEIKNYEVRAGLAEVEGFEVVGVSVVTDNTKASEDINALWELFFKESVGQSVRGKVDDVIYAVYSDYEGDHEKPYRVTIGYRVENDPHPNPPPQGGGDFFKVEVESAAYGVMSAVGEQPKALVETWEAIWSSDLPRLYKTDFEVYGARFFEEGLHEVLVHIGLKGDVIASD